MRDQKNLTRVSKMLLTVSSMQKQTTKGSTIQTFVLRQSQKPHKM
jgi:hypothetical protein